MSKFPSGSAGDLQLRGSSAESLALNYGEIKSEHSHVIGRHLATRRNLIKSSEDYMRETQVKVNNSAPQPTASEA